ncbi:MAG TPA: DUF3592 domain-containing protein [Edaphobacter sp.]
MKPTPRQLTQTEPVDDWIAVLAVVTGCRRTFETAFVNESELDAEGNYRMAEFVVSFTYEVSGKTYNDKYKSGSPKEEGETFEILYDPHKPRRNNSSGFPAPIWMRLIGWVIAAAVVLGFIWLENRFER